ncbi:hypothetical protein HKBW3S03_00252 [Candidatus Hakubella thermalkaliphila]|uniref:HNH nuclease domain-containing protein n=3 Tax=Candidatus Hakubella thermalkaliphila TaxID=2754717 RepID=A0A6V8QGQ4_9ACTN|nr:hypothetical protein [Bacillota bacterium]GFP18747.1 hypothetical protein HKBW3S03_00252 [Candidatus Hakubella thermalkaliphila]GFP43590.1 hypothetical protein HKBW3C_02720 [Candidatus Hakubella thermalkaliphila]
MARRQLTDQEKKKVVERHTKDGVLRCFVDNEPIEDPDQVEFHHITPWSEDGSTNIDNIAPVCREHHRRIRTLSLQEFRDKLNLDRFFEDGFKKADGVRLDDVLASRLGKDGYGKTCRIETYDNYVKVYWHNGQAELFPLYRCPVTHFTYFYALVSIKHLKNDRELQPRPLEPVRMWELYRHFLRYTQLAPAICRLADSQILLFDGQHKTAAQVWAGQQQVECKIYLEADPRAIKETVLTAHDKLRQMPFYTSTLIARYSDLFREDWEQYLERPGQKSEAGFVEFLVRIKDLTKAEAVKRLRSAIQNDILEYPENRLREYIAEKNKTRKNPLTVSAVQRTFFAEFVASPPIDAELESPEDFRQREKENLIRLLNLIVDISLVNRWNPEARNEAHRTAERIYAAGSLRAWAPMLRVVIAQALNLIDDEERRRVFFREVDEEAFGIIERYLKKLFSHKLWFDSDPEIDNNLRVNNPEHVKEFFRRRGLSPEWILGLEV